MNCAFCMIQGIPGTLSRATWWSKLADVHDSKTGAVEHGDEELSKGSKMQISGLLNQEARRRDESRAEGSDLRIC